MQYNTAISNGGSANHSINKCNIFSFILQCDLKLIETYFMKKQLTFPSLCITTMKIPLVTAFCECIYQSLLQKLGLYTLKGFERFFHPGLLQKVKAYSVRCSIFR